MPFFCPKSKQTNKYQTNKNKQYKQTVNYLNKLNKLFSTAFVSIFRFGIWLEVNLQKQTVLTQENFGFDFDSKFQLFNANTLELIKYFPDNSIDCVVTSPPYWKLRKYGNKSEEIGQEDSPAEYINKLVMVFKEIYRILKPAGTVWINIGDGYLPKEKTLAHVPERFIIALSDLGYIHRNTIIWQKANCLPIPAKDRFMPDFEYVYFLTKSKEYTFNMLYEDISETYKKDKRPPGVLRSKLYANSKYVKNNIFKYDPKAFDRSKEKYLKLEENPSLFKDIPNISVTYNRPDKRNMRCVWRIISDASSIDHIAMFPKELAARCIEAGSNKGDIVLDPFAGSGTTLEVALAYDRKAVGIEIEEKYCEIINKKVGHILNGLF